MHKLTGNQPEPVKQRIYGSRPVELIGESNQPEVLPHTKVYGGKRIPTIRVQLNDSDDDRELLINQKDFDADRYVRLD
ncbi:MAG: hypothetical protein O7G31_03480 [Calditrichaeota bacterium]|nr:hypothetical protein [Calditrichota bacterium]